MSGRFLGVSLGALCLTALTACSSKAQAPAEFDDTSHDAGAVDTGAAADPGFDAGEPPIGFGTTDAGPDACKKVSDTETKCDGIDDDCNGKVDDLDVGHDGICDCIRIGLLGKPGYYGSNNFQKWLQDRGTTVTRVQNSTTEPLTSAQLASFDMVIVDWLLRAYSDTELQEFKGWLEGNHGVLALSGFAPAYDVSYPNSLIKLIGLQLGGADVISGDNVVDTFMPHAITTGVQSVQFYGGSDVSEIAGGLTGTHTTFATLKGQTVGVVHEGKTARGIVWGDEWIEFDSAWAARPDINRLWANIVSFLTPRCEVPPPPK
jgi:hypothetical protein